MPLGVNVCQELAYERDQIARSGTLSPVQRAWRLLIIHSLCFDVKIVRKMMCCMTDLFRCNGE